MDARRKLLKLALLTCLCGGGPTAVGQTGAETTPNVTTVAGVRCGCGRWTCPACQQQQICPPCLPEGQVAPPMTWGPADTGSETWVSPPDAGAGQSAEMPATPDTGLPGSLSAPDAPGPSEGAASLNFSDAAVPSPAASAGSGGDSLFAMNAGAGGASGFGSSLRGATTPEMMGDFFGLGGVPSVFNLDSMTYTTPIPSAGYALGRLKLAENNSPIPRDRIFFNYSLFTGVPLAAQPVTVNRFSPGFEKTFLDGLASVELRTPFGTTVDNDVFANGLNSDNEFQFGNLFVALKGVLLQKNNWLLTGGTSVLIPTASDTRVLDPLTEEEFLRIQNEAVHLMPFLGGAYVPNSRLFLQWMVQCDIDVSGNSVVTTDDNGTSTKIGTLQDFTLLYNDISLGYWLYRAGQRSQSTITGIAPIVEVHYNRSLNGADTVSDSSNIVSGTLPAFDNVNMQLGMVFNLRNQARLGLGYATPLGNTFDRVFDNEFRLTLNRYY